MLTVNVQFAVSSSIEDAKLFRDIYYYYNIMRPLCRCLFVPKYLGQLIFVEFINQLT